MALNSANNRVQLAGSAGLAVGSESLTDVRRATEGSRPAAVLRDADAQRSQRLRQNEITAGGNSDDNADFEVRRCGASLVEAKERAHNFLRDELLKAQRDLRLKDAQCEKLQMVQVKMGEELEELTASLFEEANKMVQDANVKRMQSEKLLKESNAKIDVLQAEVDALKTLVITSTPSMPNRHLHPQLDAPRPTAGRPAASAPDNAALPPAAAAGRGAAFVKGHRRSTSHHNFSKDILETADGATVNGRDGMWAAVTAELDPVYYEEFKQWHARPAMTQTSSFLSHITSEDILPCLSFVNRDLSRSVFEGVMNNSLTIELVPDKTPLESSSTVNCSTEPNGNRKCALTDTTRLCRYRIKVQDLEPWHFISQLARNRITAVCDFITYVRYITQGLVKCEGREMYWEIIRLRQRMALARLGLS